MTLADRVNRLEQENLILIRTIEQLEDKLNRCGCDMDDEVSVEEMDLENECCCDNTTDTESSTCLEDTDTEEEEEDEWYSGEEIEDIKEIIGQLAVGEITANDFIKELKKIRG